MKFQTLILVIVLAACSASATPAAEPKLHDFAEGIELTPSTTQPLQELTLPDMVYATMTQWNAADISVFNANGQIVPHALCSTSSNAGATQTVQAPVYGLDATHVASTGNNITLRTSDGTQLNVQAGGSNAPSFRSNASYVLDVSKVNQDIDAIKLDWSSPSGEGEINVDVLASNDLSHWQNVVSNAKLLRATSADHSTLEQSRIVLPAAQYKYLRIEPLGKALIINNAQAEYHLPVEQPQPIWYPAGAPHGADDVHELRYENSRHAPVTYIRITPHSDNSSLHVTVQSRDRKDHAWQTHWSGEVFDVQYDNQHRHNDPIKIAATYAYEWRLLFPDDAEPPASAPTFELGYIPQKLRFLAQGSGPYVLAFGNARINTSTVHDCDSLLSSLNHDDKQKLIGTPVIGTPQIFAGISALKVHHEIPMRTLLLWGILLVGVVVIARAALSMLKNNKRQDEE